jgi:hypothetical protein
MRLPPPYTAGTCAKAAQRFVPLPCTQARQHTTPRREASFRRNWGTNTYNKEDEPDPKNRHPEDEPDPKNRHPYMLGFIHHNNTLFWEFPPFPP